MKVTRFLKMVPLFIMLKCANSPPEVSITYPLDASVVSGIIRITVEASDDVMEVLFYVDDSCTYVCRAAPFGYVWNTFCLPDSSAHSLYVIARDRHGNETYSTVVSVIVANGNMILADDFESYLPRKYPIEVWFEIWPGVGLDSTYVESGTAHSGAQSFRLCGNDNLVRTDGVEPIFDTIHILTYEVSLMIPAGDTTGALFGFFVLLNPSLGTIHNGIWFRGEDGLVYARGADEDSTGLSWSNDVWYTVRVSLDYDQLKMNAWVDGAQVVFDLPAMPLILTDTFALATQYGAGGIVYYDDIMIFEGD
jgi:hypothetical protein